MSWFSSSVSIDEQVQKATSESLPTGEQDLALNLEICDLIRSKTVPPKDAMRSLKRRLLNKNPNVQIATLHLVDVCIKNGGIHFLVEIASREFMDTVALLLKSVNNGTVNADLEKLTLECIQNWANAFEGQIQLAYVGQLYQRLKNEGFQFPHYSKKINSSFIDSSAPPEWVDSDTCMESGTAFSFVNRKHHCRNCGGVFIQKYCNNYAPLPHYGINIPVRICDGCYAKLKSGGGPPKRQGGQSATSSYSLSGNALNTPVIDEDMDADLKRALELSLAESNGVSQSYSAPVVPSTVPQSAEDEDEELKAAIAASIREMQGSSNAPSEHATSTVAPEPALPSAQLTQPSWELTQIETDNINMYATLVEKVQSAPPGAILREGQIQDLNENISSLRPKLARTLADTVSKYDKLVEMNAKLTTAIRFYDSLLEDRLSYAYNRHSIVETPTGNGRYSQQPQAQPYDQYHAPLQSQHSGFTPGLAQPPYSNQYPPSMTPSAPTYTSSSPLGQEHSQDANTYNSSAPTYEYSPSAPLPPQTQQLHNNQVQQPYMPPTVSRELPKEDPVLI